MSEQIEMGDCFLWTNHDDTAREAALGYARSKCQPKSDFHVLRTESEDLRSRTVLTFFVETLRRARCFSNWTTTVLTVPEHYLAVQLCTARVNQEAGPFEATGGEVLFVDSQYQQHVAAPHEHPASELVQKYVDFLAHSNTFNHWQILAKFKEIVASDGDIRARLAKCVFFVHGPIRSKFVQECLSVLFKGRRVQLLTTETPLDVSLNEGCDVSDVSVTSESLQGPVPEPIPAKVKNKTDSMTIMVRAFLRVLINSRDEVALATAMASSIVQLSHDAFTELKRLSLDRGMPMCQTAVSYVLRARLGGAAISAGPDCPLRPYICKLSDFVDVLHKLQTFAEEEDATTAVKKMVGLLVSRVRSAGDQELTWDQVLKRKTNLVELAESLESSNFETEEDPESGQTFGGKTLRVLRSVADFLSTQRLSCCPVEVVYNMDGDSQGTPLDGLRMLNYFMSPEPPEEEDEYCVPLAKRLSRKFDTKSSSPRCTSSSEDVCGKSALKNEDPGDFVPPTERENQPPTSEMLNVKTEKACLAPNRAASKAPPKKPARNTKRNLMSDINDSVKRKKRTHPAMGSRQLFSDQKKITSFFGNT